MKPTALVVGSGPAGLSAAEVLAEGGWSVTVIEALGSPARKLLRAGVGGLNLTNAQAPDAFLAAYGSHRAQLEPFLKQFGPTEFRAWVEGLGITLFTGSSGRVFPQGMGAGPLLTAWLARLERLGVRFESNTLWSGWGGDVAVNAVVLALGGPTWPALGTGGRWTSLLEARGVEIQPWQPANVGWNVAWSEVFRSKFAGQPLKDATLSIPSAGFHRKGEFMVTPWGLEGGPLYAGGAALRSAQTAQGTPIRLDLLPGRDRARVLTDLGRPRGNRSLATHLTKTLGLPSLKIGLLREVLRPGSSDEPETVAGLLKALPLTLTGPRPLDEAISAAGGVVWSEVTPELELRRIPGVWCAGEMLDWEAPTGGYLLTACFSLGRAVGHAIVAGAVRPPVSVTLTKQESP